jgi:hypothetical protein
MAAEHRYILDADVFTCAQFDVPYTDTFRMLRDLAVRFEFGGVR